VTERLSERFNDMKHRAASLRHASSCNAQKIVRVFRGDTIEHAQCAEYPVAACSDAVVEAMMRVLYRLVAPSVNIFTIAHAASAILLS